MTWITNKRFVRAEARQSSADGACKVFTEYLNDLYTLAFLLTGDHTRAEKCFIAGFDDCVAIGPVFNEWALSWAKRIVIENAIRELKPRPDNPPPLPATLASDIPDQPSVPDGPLGLTTILALNNFDRFVFIMAVLERYPLKDCALLLRCPVWEVRDSRTRVLEELASMSPEAYPHARLFPQETKVNG